MSALAPTTASEKLRTESMEGSTVWKVLEITHGRVVAENDGAGWLEAVRRRAREGCY